MPRKIFLAVAVAVLMVTAARAQQSDLSAIRAYHEIDRALSTAGQVGMDQIAALRQAGFEVVVNLAPADESRNGREGFLVAQQGMTYVQIPVDWRNPKTSDLETFFAVMAANRNRRTLVHCFANMRASAFVYLYRTLKQDVARQEATADLQAIWDPFGDERHARWAEFMKQAESVYGRRGH